MSGLGWLTQRPVAHRGLHDIAAGLVENTLPAVEAAIAHGYAVEIDVRETADGEAVVFHDAALERLTQGSGTVSALTASALTAIPFRAGAAGMPLLADLLAAVGGRVPLVIEIKKDKPQGRRLEARVAALVANYAGPVALQSFDPGTLSALRRLRCPRPRGIIASGHDEEEARMRHPAITRFLQRHMLHALHTRPDFVAYDAKSLPAPMPLFLRHAAGLPLLTWTVRSAEQAVHVRQWADQIIFEGFRP